MQQNSNLIDGIITISDKFDINAATSSVEFSPYFGHIGEEYVRSFINLQNVKSITSFTYNTLNATDNKYLSAYYRISRDQSSWTEWKELATVVDDFPIIDSKDKLFLDVKWIRIGSNIVGSLRLLNYSIIGKLERNISDDGVNLRPGNIEVIKPPYIYKVFNINNIEIISSTGIVGVDIKYRYSQDNSRSWSNWEPFTKENITTVRINPIRFCQIEYSITNTSGSNISIQDINLIGDFQNVSKDYFKTNLYGIRDCCQSNLLGIYDTNGNFIPNTNLNNGGGISGGSCDSSN